MKVPVDLAAGLAEAEAAAAAAGLSAWVLGVEAAGAAAALGAASGAGLAPPFFLSAMRNQWVKKQ